MAHPDFFEAAADPAQGSWVTADTHGPMDDRAHSEPSVPVGASDGQPPLPVEALQDLLGGLVREREEMRGTGADQLALERNRRAIVRAQWQLSHALIARYGPRADPA